MRRWMVFIVMFASLGAAQEPNCPSEPGREGLQAWMQKNGLLDGKPYEATPSRKKRIKESSKKLKLGMNRKEAETLMGKPDFVSRGRSPDGLARSNPDFKPRCWHQWAYYLSKSSPDPVDLRDSVVFLSFSEKDSLFWVAPLNVEGITPQGNPQGSETSN